MHKYKSIKNIFLGIIFLCVFLIPGIVKAEVKIIKDKEGSNVSYNSMSKSMQNTLGGLIKNSGGALAGKTALSALGYDVNIVSDSGTIVGDNVSYNLYRKNFNNVTETKLNTDVQEEIAQRFNNVNPNVKIDSSTIFSKNTGDITEYWYEDSDGNRRLMMSATEKGSLNIVKGQGIDGKNNYEDIKNFRNQIDKEEGRPVGTTEDNINRLYDATKDQQKINDEIANIDKQIANLEKTQEEGIAKDEAIAALQKARGELVNQQQNNQQIINWEQNRLASISSSRECGGTLGPFGSFYCFSMLIAQFTNIIFKLTSFVAYVVGLLFDYSLEVSINSAEFFNQLGVIEVTWTFLRDILNITFIFILLWAAIQILIGNEAQYNARKVLMSVVIVAILINFSLFAAKLMVDGSNIVSLKIYESMKVSGNENQRATISERVMNTVGMTALYDITKIFDNNTISSGNACANNPGALITVSVMGSIFLIVLSLALGLAGVLFIIRLVNIIFLFIKSPLWVWGYVLPNNPKINKLSKDWESQMKHVLMFPILYLFWMLVAVIIFTQLGKNSGGVSFLDLVCSGPISAQGTQTISILFVFIIVIIFLMRTISYGVKNATTDGAVGGDMAKNWAGKFDKWQTAATTGLAKKTYEKSKAGAVAVGSLAAGAGIGAAKFTGRLGGRVGAGAIGAGIAKYRGKDAKEGWNEGFLNPGINMKESIRDWARDRAANNPNNMFGSAAAKLANRYNEPTNSAGKTRKQVEDERVKKAQEDEALIYKAIDAKYKVESQKDWMKKKENAGKSADDYENYIIGQMEKRTDALLGAGVSNSEGKDGKKHLDALKEAAISRSVDKDGNTQVRFNEHAMHTTVENIIKYHSEGEGLDKLNLSDGKKRLEVLRNRRKVARIKTISDSVKESKKKSKGKLDDEQRTKTFEADIKSIEEKIKKMPDEDVIKNLAEQAITNIENGTAPTKYTGYADNHKDAGLKDLNTAIDNYYNLSYSQTASADEIKSAKEKIKEAQDKHTEYLSKIKSSLSSKNMALSNHLQKIDDANKTK